MCERSSVQTGRSFRRHVNARPERKSFLRVFAAGSRRIQISSFSFEWKNIPLGPCRYLRFFALSAQRPRRAPGQVLKKLVSPVAPSRGGSSISSGKPFTETSNRCGHRDRRPVSLVQAGKESPPEAAQPTLCVFQNPLAPRPCLSGPKGSPSSRHVSAPCLAMSKDSHSQIPGIATFFYLSGSRHVLSAPN
jgi:hypothetical protein